MKRRRELKLKRLARWAFDSTLPLVTASLYFPQIVKAAAKRAGIKGKVSPHWLRHAHATHALERGAKIHLVAETLGHSSVAITSRYLHARPEDSSSLYLPG